MRARKPRKTRTRRINNFLPHAIGVTGGVVVAAAAFWFFRGQAERVVAGRADALDETILRKVHQVQSRRVTAVMRVSSFLGEHPTIGGIGWITATALRTQGRPTEAWTVVLNTVGAMMLNTTLKAIFQRQRPQERARHIRLPRSHSFPSGHSLITAATYPIVVHHMVENRSVPVQIAAHTAAGVIIGSVGFSRIYFGVHFPSDVLGGFAAGLGWLGLTGLTHSMITASEEAGAGSGEISAAGGSPDRNFRGQTAT